MPAHTIRSKRSLARPRSRGATARAPRRSRVHDGPSRRGADAHCGDLGRRIDGGGGGGGTGWLAAFGAEAAGAGVAALVALAAVEGAEGEGAVGGVGEDLGRL